MEVSLIVRKREKYSFFMLVLAARIIFFKKLTRVFERGKYLGIKGYKDD